MTDVYTKKILFFKFNCIKHYTLTTFEFDSDTMTFLERLKDLLKKDNIEILKVIANNYYLDKSQHIEFDNSFHTDYTVKARKSANNPSKKRDSYTDYQFITIKYRVIY